MNQFKSKKELLAIVKAVEHFKQFLYGKEFIIKTDHQPLIAIKTKTKPSIRLGRWPITILRSSIRKAPTTS